MASTWQLAVDGYQAPEAWPGVEAQLKALKLDLVLVALGVPRQETWSERMAVWAARTVDGCRRQF